MDLVASIATWQKPLAAGLVLLWLAVLVYAASRRGRVGIAFLGIALVLLAAWVAARVAVDADYRDADGFADCWPGCTLFQDAVGLAFWYLPILLVALGLVAAVLAAMTRRRCDPGDPPSTTGG